MYNLNGPLREQRHSMRISQMRRLGASSRWLKPTQGRPVEYHTSKVGLEPESTPAAPADGQIGPIDIERPTTFKETDDSVCRDRKILDLNPVQDPKRTITVSSYNILSRHYLWTGKGIYDYLPEAYLNWKNRLQLLNRNFSDMSRYCDLMCFQEMEFKMYNEVWKHYMEERNFGSVFERKLRPGYWDKNLNMMDGASVFYNRNTFKLLNYERIEYTECFRNPVFFEQTLDTKDRLVSRNNVALILVMEHIPTKETVFVTNTHLYWSPRHEDVKLMQMYELTRLIFKSIRRWYNCTDEEVTEMLESDDGVNILLVGDLNSSPGSMVYRYLREGKIDITDEEEMHRFDYGATVPPVITDPLGKFSSPYQDLYDQGLFHRTAYLQRFKKIIDYTFYNEHSKRLRPTKVLDELDLNKTYEYLGFPNADYPSDHLPIITQFELLKKSQDRPKPKL